MVPDRPTARSIYRHEYRYEGDGLVAGSPARRRAGRTRAADAREHVRARLGIDPEATVVIYAPTWREADATGEWSARIFDELDLSGWPTAWVRDHTVLLRGHTYNLPDAGPMAAAERPGVWTSPATPRSTT